MDKNSKLKEMRIPLQIGSELRFKNNGELRISNPTIEAEPSEILADAVLSYRFDEKAAEHVIRLAEPRIPSVAEAGERRSEKEAEAGERTSSVEKEPEP